jgi:hypothetical protein
MPVPSPSSPPSGGNLRSFARILSLTCHVTVAIWTVGCAAALIGGLVERADINPQLGSARGIHDMGQMILLIVWFVFAVVGEVVALGLGRLGGKAVPPSPTST